MLIEALIGINVAVAQENPSLRDAFTKLTAEEKRAIYLDTLTEAELERIESFKPTPSAEDPWWCLYDPELFAVVDETCGPNPKTLSKTGAE